MAETAAARLTRLLALVPWLDANPGVTLAETAAHFAVTQEQLAEDLRLLVLTEINGYYGGQLVDIDFWNSDDDGKPAVGGPIQVVDPRSFDRPLRLSQEEAAALLVALQMLSEVPGLSDRDAILSAIAKIEAAAGVAGTSGAVAVAVAVAPGVREAVSAALVGGRVLEIEYASLSKDEVTRRTVEPQRLSVSDGVTYLQAYCRQAGALRTFRLDRVLSAQPGDVVVNAAAPVPDVAILPPPPSDYAVLAVRDTARWMIDVYGAEPVDTTATSVTRVRLPMPSVPYVRDLVLSLHGSVTALEPPELVVAVADAASAALAAYADDIR